MAITHPNDEPDETGVTLRPWSKFQRVLAHLQEHSDDTKSVTPSDGWMEWLQDRDDQVPFSPLDKLDLMCSLWILMERTTDRKPSHHRPNYLEWTPSSPSDHTASGHDMETLEAEPTQGP